MPVFTLKKVNSLNRLKSTGDAVRELYIQPIVNKTRKRRRKRRVNKVKDVSEWGVPEWKSFTTSATVFVFATY